MVNELDAWLASIAGVLDPEGELISVRLILATRMIRLIRRSNYEILGEMPIPDGISLLMGAVRCENYLLDRSHAIQKHTFRNNVTGYGVFYFDEAPFMVKGGDVDATLAVLRFGGTLQK